MSFATVCNSELNVLARRLLAVRHPLRIALAAAVIPVLLMLLTALCVSFPEAVMVPISSVLSEAGLVWLPLVVGVAGLPLLGLSMFFVEIHWSKRFEPEKALVGVKFGMLISGFYAANIVAFGLYYWPN